MRLELSYDKLCDLLVDKLNPYCLQVQHPNEDEGITITLIGSRVQFVNLWPHFKARHFRSMLYSIVLCDYFVFFFHYFKGCYEVLLFLPPQYHILLKCSPDDSTSVVEIATDHWMLLPFIGDWLKNTLMSS